MTDTLARHASPVTELPSSFFLPPPVQHAGRIVERFPDESTGVARTVRRGVALGTATVWLLLLLLRVVLTGEDLPTVCWWCAVVSVVVLIAGVLDRGVAPVLLMAGGLSGVVLGGYLLSLFPDSGIGQYVGLPLTMVAAVAPRVGGTVAASLIVTLAVLAYRTSTPGPVVETALGLIWAWPLFILVFMASRAAAAIDEIVARTHRDTLHLAGSRALHELETRFLAYVHDHVLSLLDGVRRGILPAARARVDPAALLESAPGTSAPMPLGGVISYLVAHARQTDPELLVTAPTEVPTAATMPADVAASLRDALVEAVSNGVRHAGPGPRRCALELDGGSGLRVRVSDEGPGFDPRAVPAHRAGLRVAITGRMAGTEGCTSEVSSAPGRGTTVTLAWSPTGPAPQEPAGVPFEDLTPTWIFRTQHAVVAGLVVLGLGLAGGWQVPSLVVAMVAVSVLLWALLQGEHLRLPTPATVVAAVALPVFLASTLIDATPPAPHLPVLWQLWIHVLFCLYLAIRGRWGVAVGSWMVGVALVGWWGPADGWMRDLLTMSVLMVPAAAAPRLVALLNRRLGGELAEEYRRTAGLSLIAARRSFLADSAAWIGGQLTTALDPARSPETLRANAHLLELRLRDSIRSPLFQEEEITRAVWEARARGVTVRLYDDRTTLLHHSDPDERTRATHRVLLDALADPTSRTITARLLPVGRADYAGIMVVDAAGETHREVISARDP